MYWKKLIIELEINDSKNLFNWTSWNGSFVYFEWFAMKFPVKFTSVIKRFEKFIQTKMICLSFSIHIDWNTYTEFIDTFLWISFSFITKDRNSLYSSIGSMFDEIQTISRMWKADDVWRLCSFVHFLLFILKAFGLDFQLDINQ